MADEAREKLVPISAILDVIRIEAARVARNVAAEMLFPRTGTKGDPSRPICEEKCGDCGWHCPDPNEATRDDCMHDPVPTYRWRTSQACCHWTPRRSPEPAPVHPEFV